MNTIFIGRITVAVSFRNVNRKEKYSKNKIQRIQPLDFPLECGKLITRSVLTAFSENIVRLKISVQKEDVSQRKPTNWYTTLMRLFHLTRNFINRISVEVRHMSECLQSREF